MAFLQGFREKIGAFRAKKNRAERIKGNKKVSFSNTQNIGIIFNASNYKVVDEVKSVVKDLTAEGKSVKAIGFVDLTLATEQPMTTLRFDFFTSKDLDFFFVPKAMVCSNFMEMEFDVLIELNYDNDLPINYLAACSKAFIKAGSNISGTTNYDLRIELKKKESPKFVLDQIIRYLKMMDGDQPSA
jgi:ABC-type uncharacterized transport system substrate-binding protein